MGWIVAASDTLPVPSKLIGEATISPVISNVLAFWSFVAVEIVPVIAPINVETPDTRSCWDVKFVVLVIPRVLIPL